RSRDASCQCQESAGRCRPVRWPFQPWQQPLGRTRVYPNARPERDIVFPSTPVSAQESPAHSGMTLKARPLRQPAPNQGRLVSGVVAENGMDLQLDRSAWHDTGRTSIFLTSEIEAR